jgi:hypothetical protein
MKEDNWQYFYKYNPRQLLPLTVYYFPAARERIAVISCEGVWPALAA